MKVRIESDSGDDEVRVSCHTLDREYKEIEIVRVSGKTLADALQEAINAFDNMQEAAFLEMKKMGMIRDSSDGAGAS